MDPQTPATLLQLAIQSLPSNEPAVLRALEETPQRLFVPLFNAAFMGGHKDIITRMVRIWPYSCLHMGALNVQEPHCEVLKAMIETLPVFPSQDTDSW